MDWPLDPGWFYQDGSGPLFDVGVYGFHELTGILGPARRVSAFSGITDRQRAVVGGPLDGQVIDVTADDNTVLLLDFGDSCFGMVDGTFNVHATRAPRMEVFGREGTLVMTYNINETGSAAAGAVPGGYTWARWAARRVGRAGSEPPRRPAAACRPAAARGASRAPGRTPGQGLSLAHARYVLEIMLKAQESARTGRAVNLAASL